MFFVLGVGTGMVVRASDLHSSCSKAPNVGLCFSADFFLSGTTCSALGAPIRSRAISFTAFTARNGFAFFFLAMAFRKCNPLRKVL